MVGMGLVTVVLAVGFVLFAAWGKVSGSGFGTPVAAPKP
jgi:hypothetical protein